MKKLISYASLLLMLALVSPANAQSTIGFRFGANIANQDWASDPPAGIAKTSLTGVIVGVQLDYWLADMFAFESQVLFDEKGTNVAYDFYSGEVHTTGSRVIDAYYLEVPILFKFRLPTTLIRPYVFAGPSFGILLASKSTSTGRNGSSDITIINNSPLSGADLSALFGLGVEFHISDKLNAFIDVGEAFGLGKVSDNLDENPFRAERITSAKSHDLRILAGVVLPL